MLLKKILTKLELSRTGTSGLLVEIVHYGERPKEL